MCHFHDITRSYCADGNDLPSISSVDVGISLVSVVDVRLMLKKDVMAASSTQLETPQKKGNIVGRRTDTHS